MFISISKRGRLKRLLIGNQTRCLNANIVRVFLGPLAWGPFLALQTGFFFLASSSFHRLSQPALCSTSQPRRLLNYLTLQGRHLHSPLQLLRPLRLCLRQYR